MKKNKWINEKAFKKYQESKKIDYIIPEEEEQTEEEKAEIKRLEKKRENHQKASIKSWKTRRRNAFVKAFEKFKKEGIQPVFENGQLEKRYIIGSVSVPVDDINCIEVFETIYDHVRKKKMHDEKKINIESLLSDYLSIKNGLMKKGRKEKNERQKGSKQAVLS